jgi:DUF1365 family protein
MVKFFQAKVFHKRLIPKNVFCYKAGYITLPLIKDCTKPRFFSINKTNIFSFYDKDHGERNGKSTLDWVYKKLNEVGVKASEVREVILLTHPRCFGFVFNPVSFYFCLDAKLQPIVIIAEVNNTFSQTHSYIIHEKDLSHIVQNKIYTTKKEFFVSPFFKVEGHYEFNFSYSEEKIAIFINYFKDGSLAFETSLVGKIVEFTSCNALPYVLTTFKTVILISFQAIILKFIKKLQFRKPPIQTHNKTTVNKL